MSRRWTCTAFAGLTASLLLSMVAYAKPAPVPAVMGLFESLYELEESTRNEKWAEASERVTGIESKYKSLIPEIKGAVPGETITKFSFLLKSLQKAVASKDDDKIEEPMEQVTDLFVVIMDHFEYKEPPILLVLKKQIEEAEESIKGGKFAFAEEEIEEIAEMKERTKKSLAAYKKDTTALDAAFATLDGVLAAVKKKDKGEAEKQLGAFEAALEKL